MTDHPPRVVLTPRAAPRGSRVTWCSESLVLTVALDARADEPSVEMLAQQIDHARGIERRRLRLILGEMDVALDPECRVDGFEIRTNPDGWRNASEPAVSGSLERVDVTPTVELDENGIASRDVEVRGVLDRTSRQLTLQLGEYRAARWAELAQDVLVGTTRDGHMAALRLLGVVDEVRARE